MGVGVAMRTKRPRLGGEPLWKMAGLSGGQQAAPGNYPASEYQSYASNRTVLTKVTNVRNDGKSWAASGSRLLQTDRAATLRSGSPPGRGRATLQCSLGGRERSVLSGYQAENRTTSAGGAVRRLLFCVSSIWPRLNGGDPAHLARRFRG
jgi:hypothetical protein